jgi:hypothetical protein
MFPAPAGLPRRNGASIIEGTIMKRWIVVAVVGLFSFAALADDTSAATADKTAKTKKPTKKKADGKKDDAQKKTEAK